MLFPHGTDYLYCDHDECRKQQHGQKKDQPILVQIIGKLIPVEAPGCIVQNICLTFRVIQFCNPAIQTLYRRPPFRSIRCTRPKVHGKHGRRLDYQIAVGRFLQHITPDIRVMQEGIDFTVPERLHAVTHCVICADLHAGIKLPESFNTAAQGSDHTDTKLIKRRQFPVSDRYEGKRGLHEIVRNNGRLPGSACNGAAKGHDNIVVGIIEGFLQVRLPDKLKCGIKPGLSCGKAHQVNPDPDRFSGIRIPVKNGTAVFRHTHSQVVLILLLWISRSRYREAEYDNQDA